MADAAQVSQSNADLELAGTDHKTENIHHQAAKPVYNYEHGLHRPEMRGDFGLSRMNTLGLSRLSDRTYDARKSQEHAVSDLRSPRLWILCVVVLVLVGAIVGGSVGGVAAARKKDEQV
jgi:hypothetical protein